MRSRDLFNKKEAENEIMENGKKPMERVEKNKGFTLIELLVVIAIIALLLSILIPALSRVKLVGLRILCANDLRQQGLGTMLFANEHDSEVPMTIGGAANWLWDMPFDTTKQISDYAGFDDNKTFFCPADKVKQHDDARFWQYSWLYPGPYPNKEPLRDESRLRPDQLRDLFRVLPMVYMFDKLNADRSSKLPTRLMTGEDAKWIRKLSGVPNASAKVMIMDVVISENNWNFFAIESGGIWVMTQKNVADNSNHASRQFITSGPFKGPKPEGSNVVYADGHADWRRFENMKHRLSYGQWFWW